ncbi:MAG: hypothetical protein ISR65_16845 [Bacteriovoracaceae bacterium]|nr:hypothetical protein [Bacteriovoracaceae bacterium]
MKKLIYVLLLSVISQFAMGTTFFESIKCSGNYEGAPYVVKVLSDMSGSVGMTILKVKHTPIAMASTDTKLQSLRNDVLVITSTYVNAFEPDKPMYFFKAELNQLTGKSTTAVLKDNTDDVEVKLQCESSMPME